MYNDITGVILSGGKNSRIGVNKSLLKIRGKTAIEITADLMKSIFQQNILSTNSPSEYKFLNLPIVEDVYKNLGPLSGIHSALLKSSTEKNFVISCDVPLMSKEMIEYLINYKTEKQILITRAAGYLQPLVGVYNKSILPSIEKILMQDSHSTIGKRKCNSIHSLLESVQTEIIDPTSLPFYSDELFFNMNDKDDYAKING